MASAPETCSQNVEETTSAPSFYQALPLEARDVLVSKKNEANINFRGNGRFMKSDAYVGNQDAGAP